MTIAKLHLIHGAKVKTLIVNSLMKEEIRPLPNYSWFTEQRWRHWLAICWCKRRYDHRKTTIDTWSEGDGIYCQSINMYELMSRPSPNYSWFREQRQAAKAFTADSLVYERHLRAYLHDRFSGQFCTKGIAGRFYMACFQGTFVQGHHSAFFHNRYWVHFCTRSTSGHFYTTGSKGAFGQWASKGTFIAGFRGTFVQEVP